MTARFAFAAASLVFVLVSYGPVATAAPPTVAEAAASRLPPSPPGEIAGFVGEYGAPEDMLVVLEREGRLQAFRGEGEPVALRRLSPLAFAGPGLGRIAFTRGAGGRIEAANLDGRRLARRDLGAEVEARIRAAVRADPAARRAAALAAQPPVETNRPRMFDLVPLASVDPSSGSTSAMPAATTSWAFRSTSGRAPGCSGRRPWRWARAQRSLKAKGYGLLVFDAYRPWFVTKMFWDATPPEHRMFVADPAQGSRHNRGAAVDLTLYDLATGQPVEMPGRYDEFSKRSYPGFRGGTSRQRWLRDLLRREMEQQGFTVYPEEWWHFDYRDWARYPIGNVTFTELAAPQGR